MANRAEKIIWTIGHSTHSIDQFIEMLNAFEIEIVVDIRRFPGSRKFPQFNQEALKESLQGEKIDYTYLEDLGGRRKVNPNSKNIAWRNTSFRAYADYMESAEFKNAFEKLEQIALKQSTAYLCSEAVWWRCHRALVSDLLKISDWEVKHIMTAKKVMEHPYTQPAQVVEGELRYDIKVEEE